MSTIPKTFIDMINIVESRAKIKGDVQDRDREFVKTAINEAYFNIATERAWHWRKFDRTYNFLPAVTTGTVDVTQFSREVTFTGLTVAETFLGKSIKINSTQELYRIIGLDISNNKVLLSSPYVGATASAASHILYSYEFALPPDLDTITSFHISSPFYGSASGSGILEDINVLEFNQKLSVAADFVGPPTHYTRDGDIPAESLPPLDEMVLDYDFLGGELYERISRARVFPINPDIERVLYLNYTRMPDVLSADTDVPLMPLDNRWILIHMALATWHRTNNSGSMADRELSIANGMLAEMRQEFIKTDIRPTFVFDARRYKRSRDFSDYRLLHQLSRIGES